MTYRKLTRALHVLLLIAGIFVLIALGLVLLRARTAVQKLQYTIENANRTIIIAGASLREIHLAEQAQIKQFDATQKALTQTIQTLNRNAAASLAGVNQATASLQTMIDNTNAQVNSNLLPAAAKTLSGLQDSELQLSAMLTEGRGSLQQFNSTTLPAFNLELTALHNTTVQAAGATANASLLLGHANNIVAHYDKMVNTKQGKLALIGHWGEGFAASVLADIVALKATGH